MLDSLKREDFDPYLGTELPLTVAGQPTQALLAEVRTLSSPSPRAAAPFALTFVVPRELPVGQGTHCLVHPTLGALELFMVPIGPEPRGMRYEAIFN